MFCPKCGSETLETQRFCKACGTNLQLINEAIRTGDTPQGPFGIDVDTLAKNAREFAQSWKASWGGLGEKHRPDSQRVIGLRLTRELKRQAREEARRQNLPKPREYMSYSWQHNLRSGLVSLFWGTGLGIFLYYFGKTVIDAGLVQQLEENPNVHVHGLDMVVRMMWLIALLPVLKGAARIIFASFFAESMATLTERFTPKLALESQPASIRQNTAPVEDRETAPGTYEHSHESPPSVTEHTTHIFEETQ
jgi:zinc ribbon protein